MLYQVAVKKGDLVVFTSIEEAATPNDAAEASCKCSQLRYDSVEVFDAFDDSADAQPLLTKARFPSPSQVFPK